MKITIDCGGIATKEELHAHIAAMLDFPDWYGHNLDALMDCLTDLTDTTVTLTLIKNDDTPLYAAVYDRLGDALACTDPSYKVDGAVIRHGRIKIYADGSDTPATELPTAPGRYTLVVDFASIRNGTYPMQDYIGFFANIGKNGTPVTVYFSLKVPEETTTEDATDHTEAETAEDTSETRP